MKSGLRKLKSNTGFSLAEMLITILILLMVSSVVAGGIPAAANAYTKAVDAANAHALLSTTVSALRDEFSTAWNVEMENGAITYFSSDTGSQSRIRVDGGSILLQEYADLADEAKATGGTAPVPERPIISNASTVKGKLSVICESITYDANTNLVTVEGLKVQRNASGNTGGGTVIAQMPASGFQIRVLSGEAKT